MTDDPRLSLQRAGGVSVLVLAGAVDGELAAEAGTIVRGLVADRDDAIAIDVSGVEAVNGAVLGLLLRASRRLAWRNRRLYVVCVQPELRTRLRIAGIDELATLVDTVPVSSREPH